MATLPEQRNPFGPSVLVESIYKILEDYQFYYVDSLTIDYNSEEPESN